MDKRGILVTSLAAAALLAGCAANKQRQREEDLDRIVRWLPGTYDNTAQAQADAQQGVRAPHDAVELAIVPLGSVSVGRNAFYMQEMAADDARRVLSQSVLIFSVTDKGIVESMSSLVDPLRWRDGQRDPDVFMGMTPKDFTTPSGCELIWQTEEPSAGSKPARKPTKEEAQQAAEIARFVAANDPTHCQTTSHAVMGLVDVELRAQLTANEFAMAELQYDANGQLIQGNKHEPFYRFRKLGK
ncbi:MAG: CpcT/CpeT family chromophore lyase [Steroidobacteraceae bacterium]